MIVNSRSTESTVWKVLWNINISGTVADAVISQRECKVPFWKPSRIQSVICQIQFVRRPLARKVNGDLTSHDVCQLFEESGVWVACWACGVLGHGGACQQCQQCHRIWTGRVTHDPLTTTNQTEFSAQWWYEKFQPSIPSWGPLSNGLALLGCGGPSCGAPNYWPPITGAIWNQSPRDPLGLRRPLTDGGEYKQWDTIPRLIQSGRP